MKYYLNYLIVFLTDILKYDVLRKLTKNFILLNVFCFIVKFIFNCLGKQELQQQQSQMMQNLNSQLNTQLNIGGSSCYVFKSLNLCENI